ncbi:MAG: hypothetical protein E7571_01855 [Ruminococcaceae bacterium]|nr:hypothetical protein [Oscillospiraceae bacterium]
MKTSKKLLSLFLALVMVITSCSVGLTAFAADGNRTDSNNTYWNDGTDASAAFDALNTLAPEILQIDAVKGLLEDKLGMTVDENTTISDVVAAASPLIMGLLGGAVDKSTIIPGYSKLTEYYYSYLDGDGTAPISFYTLYNFCKQNQSAGGELGKYCQETLPKLNELLNQYNVAGAKFSQQLDDAQNALGNDYGAYLPSDTSMTKSQVRNIDVNGTPFSECPAGDAQFLIDYLNGMFESYGSPERAENIADVVYYMMMDEGGARFITARFLGTALLGGATIKPDGTTALTLSNYADVLGNVYSLAQYCSDNSIDYDALSDKEKAIVDEHYDSSLVMMGLQYVLPEFNTDSSLSSPYYEELCLGLMVYTGAFGNLDACKKLADDAKITDAQFNEFCKYLKDELHLTGYDVNAIKNYLENNSPFSAQATKYFLGYMTDSQSRDIVAEFFEKCIDNPSEARNYVLHDNDYNSVYLFKNGKDGNALSMVDRLNAMMASEVLIDKFGDDMKNKGGISARDASEPALYTEDFFNYNFGIKSNITETYKYEGDIVIPDKLMVQAVNATLNGLLSQYLDPNTQIGGIISSVLEGLLETPIELYNDQGTGVLNDVWLKLYNNPVEEIFNLLPTLTIAVDELVVPILLNKEGDKYNGFLYDLLCTGDGILAKYTQAAGNTDIGLGTLNIDLNKSIPAILNWLVGEEDKAIDIVGTYSGDYSSDVPKFLNIYVADKALAGAHLNGGLAKVLKKNESFQGDNAYLADSIDEAVTEIASFALKAIEDYLDANENDKRYDSEGTVTQNGLNNVFVALPQILDQIGQNYISKYRVDSDWTYTYDGKIQNITKSTTGGDVQQKINNTLQDFKNLATSNDPAAILDNFVGIFIGNWINGLLDIVNDTISDPSNRITSNLVLVQGLLDALGGFGEKSIITDVLNGLFQLKRSDVASFTLKERTETGFVGFSNESGFFLLSNIQFKKDGKTKGLIPFISTLIKPDDKNKANYSVEKVFKATPKLSASSKANKSAAGTDYSKLLSKKNVKAAQKLVDVLDELLSSLLENTSVNGFDLDATDNILSGVVSFASAYLGYQNTNDIVKLVNNYLYYINGEKSTVKSTSGKIGTRPTKDGDVDVKKVYTPENLSNLVIQTYSLLENIVDYLFYNKSNGFLSTRDPNMLVADAAYGIISPDAVAVRLSDDYSDTAEVLSSTDYHNWNSFKIKITDANKKDGKYLQNYLKFNFSKGDKEAFYDGLGESLNGVAAIIGVILTDSSISDSTRDQNYYSGILYPVLNSVAKATGASGVMSPADFNAASPSDQLIKGIITPLSSILDQLYDKPASFILNLVKGAAGVLDDDSVNSIINSALAPIGGLAIGAISVVSNLSPTLANKIAELLSNLIGDGIDIPSKDIIVNLINNISIGNMKVKDVINLPSINWKKLASAKSPAEVLLLVYGYLVDSVLHSELISGLIDSFAPGLTKMLKKLDAVQILTIISDVIESVQSPTEIYWTFREYIGKISNTFVYPQGILASDADKAVGQLDDLVANVFPLLNSLGVTDIKGLGDLVNDKLYTNDLLTTAAKGIYGALSKGTAGDVLAALGFDLSPKGFAAYLTNSSYGKTYTSAAATLKKAKSWDKVTKLNWGFTNGSSKAQTGFINGLAAVLRPLNDVLAVFLAEGSLKKAIDLDVVKIAKMLDLKGSTKLGSGEYGATLDYKLKKGMLTVGIRSNVKTASNNMNVRNEIKVDVNAIAKDLQDILDGSKGINLGTNGYESAVIPILEAFMCDGVKTYKQYKKDYNKAKDNLIINILKPLFGFVDDVTDKPFDTLTKVLPNVGYFIENNGVAQAVGNLLAPLTAKDGILGVLKKDGLDIDKLIKLIFAKDLGSIVADALNINAKLTIDLNHMEKTNIQVIVVPLVNKILADNKLGIKLPDISFKKLASHGTVKVVRSAAKNDEGKYTTRQVKADQGETLVATFRYIADVLIKNASAIDSLLGNIDAIKKNNTIKSILDSVFASIGLAGKDDIVGAIFYFLTEQATDKFFDYTDFKYDDTYKFTWGDMDEEFCRKLAPMLDGMIGSLLEGGLTGLVEEKLYTDDIVAKLATGLYGAVEGVNINDKIGSLTNLLKQTDIDFTTSNVANLLVNEDYGQTYPAAANVIKNAGSWKNVKAENLKFGVKDRDSFLNALVAVLRPIYGVLDVILNDASLNLFNLVSVPGSDGYTSTIVPLLEAFGVYNIKTQYQYREDSFKAYDNILLDILNPLWDKVEDILNAPLQTLMSILPNLSLFFANDGLLQIVDNLLTPVSELLKALKPIANVNEILDAAGLDIPKLLKDKVGLSVSKFDLYDLPGTLKPLVGADTVVNTINAIIGSIKIKGQPLGLVLPEIDWFQLASHGKFILNGTSQAACLGSRIFVVADEDETLIALLRFLINTVNYKDNYDKIVNLITGLIGNADESLVGTINQVLGLLKGDADTVIANLVDLLQSIAG